MKKLAKHLILFATFLLAACTPEPFLSLGEGQSKEIKISSNAETATISFNANNAWTARSSESWLTLSPSSGDAGTTKVTVSAVANTTYDSRSASVTITSQGLSQSITVVQAQKDGYELKDTAFEIGSDGGTINIPIKANADYNCEVAADSKEWISVTKTKALSDYTIELTIAKNTYTDSRKGSVKVKMNGAESTITITQSQMDELIVDTKSFEIGSNGGTIRIPIKANIEYTSEVLESGKGWIEISENQTKGLEDYTLALNIKENKGYYGRVGKVKVVGAGKESVITITQKLPVMVNIDETPIELSCESRTFEITAFSTIDLEVKSDADWIKLIDTKVAKRVNYVYTFSIETNPLVSARNTNIHFVNKEFGVDKEVVVNQALNDYLIVHNSTAGALSETLSGYEFNKIKKLEIIGSINNDDLLFVKNNCTDLTHLNIGGTDLKSIREWTLCNCSSLTSITIPNSVSSIGVYAFAGCLSLTSITIPSSVRFIRVYAFYHCSSLTSITIPESITSIEDSTFGYCSSLTSITIPNSVRSIGSGAFAGCSSLTTINCKPTTPPNISSTTFKNIATNAEIFVPRNSVDAYKSANNWSTYSSIIRPYDY